MGCRLILLTTFLLLAPPASLPQLLVFSLQIGAWIWAGVWWGKWLKVAQDGQTTGKRWLGLHVVHLEVDGHPPLGLGQMMLRSLIRQAWHYTGIGLLIDLILLLRDGPRHRGIADRLLGSGVVRMIPG